MTHGLKRGAPSILNTSRCIWKRRTRQTPTPFGGNVPYSKLIRFPGKTLLWAGYAFAVDFNEDRGRYYSQIDQTKTKRVDRDYLNAHGLPNFRGQPSACMNCRSGWAAQQVDEFGWETFNSMPYFDTVELLRERHGEGAEGAELGSTCADCHSPDMRLRVNRQGFINAMVKRGYEADPVTGLKGSQTEMLDYVCAQCHVEYYFKGPDNELVFPWEQWPKGEALTFEMIEAYYEAERAKPGGFQADFTHAVTKAPMLKMQHPEYEMTSSGRHAGQIGCVDCHMPQIEREGNTMTDHTMGSPLTKLDSCMKCHSRVTKAGLYQRVVDLQVRNMAEYIRAEKAIVALIQDIATVREGMASIAPFNELDDDGAREAAITQTLSDVLNYHRRASIRWDWVDAENSSGAHSPSEALRVFGQAIDLAREGQEKLLTVAGEYGIALELTVDPVMPAAPEPITAGSILGSPPTLTAQEADQVVQALLDAGN
ncbi:MAG: ammonia-forming cytochrome c nitrite reductase subunit c552 [Gammaproteobacteria bacterium]